MEPVESQANINTSYLIIRLNNDGKANSLSDIPLWAGVPLPLC